MRNKRALLSYGALNNKMKGWCLTIIQTCGKQTLLFRGASCNVITIACYGYTICYIPDTRGINYGLYTSGNGVNNPLGIEENGWTSTLSVGVLGVRVVFDGTSGEMETLFQFILCHFVD